MKTLLVLGSALLGGMASAALHPYDQRNVEIDTVVKNAEVRSAVTAHSATAHGGTGVVDGVSFTALLKTRLGGTLYRVTSGRCTLDVTVQYEHKPGIIGPPDLHLSSAKDMTCPRFPRR